MKFPLILRRHHTKTLAASDRKIKKERARVDRLKAKRGLLEKKQKTAQNVIEVCKAELVISKRELDAIKSELKTTGKQLETYKLFMALPTIWSQPEVSNPSSPLEANPLAYLSLDVEEWFSNWRLAESLIDLLSSPTIRCRIAQKRWEVFLAAGAELSIHASSDTGVHKDTIAHNTLGVTNSLSSLPMLERSELVFRPVMALDRIYSYRTRAVFPDLKMLLVGSRTEYEVLLALSYGVAPSNLKAIDLISYSPWIMTGDMHSLPFADNTFDVLILGWTLGYSKTPDRVAREITRVCKPGALVSIGNDCYTMEVQRSSNFFCENRPQNVKELMGCFGGNAGRLFFAHDADYNQGDIDGFTGHMIATFEIKK